MSQFAKKFMSRVEFDPNAGCWLWAGPVTRKGYGQLWWNGTRQSAHRLSFETHVGPIPDEAHILHSCDTPCCVNPTHLRPGTNGENVADRVARGRSKSGQGRGEKNSRHKLTTSDVLEIRASSETQTAVAARYGVDQGLISRIRSRKYWSHI